METETETENNDRKDSERVRSDIERNGSKGTEKSEWG